MALSDTAKMLKERKKSMSKKPDEKKGDEGGDELTEETMMAELEKAAKGGDDAGEGEAEVEVSAEEGAETDANMGGGEGAEAGNEDPVKVFADVLEMDDLTAQAVYGEAMSMPELGEMSPDQMAKKIKGDYQMLKKILMAMGEKAAMAMNDELSKPSDMPADVGAPGGGAPAGGMGPMA